MLSHNAIHTVLAEVSESEALSAYVTWPVSKHSPVIFHTFVIAIYGLWDPIVVDRVKTSWAIVTSATLILWVVQGQAGEMEDDPLTFLWTSLFNFDTHLVPTDVDTR